LIFWTEYSVILSEKIRKVSLTDGDGEGFFGLSCKATPWLLLDIICLGIPAL
jgi:hypothetical protein